MINQSKRQTLTLMTAGLLTSALPAGVLSASSNTGSKAGVKNSAYNGSTLLTDVSIVVSTLGVHSAITTITNNSNKTVAITNLSPGIIDHKGRRYDTNAAIGSAGVTLKPGWTRMLQAQAIKSVLA